VTAQPHSEGSRRKGAALENRALRAGVARKSGVVQRILVVGDLAAARSQIASALKTLGAETIEASDGLEALQILSRASADVVVTDLHMPGMGGLELLRALSDRLLPVILYSGSRDVEASVQAVQLGAVDFFSVPIDFERLRERVGDCLYRGRLVQQILVGASPQLERLRSLVSRLAGERSPVLISGEIGVGKSAVARALHQTSPWRERPLIQIPVWAGERSGADPGEDLAAKVERAYGGVILLDQISDATPDQQVQIWRLMRRLQVASQGGRRGSRLLVTTRNDLAKRVAEGCFREDLWYHIAALHIHVPPLRQRLEDIDVLVTLELERLSRERAGPPFLLDESGYERLRRHSWPGNVLELQLVLRRMAVLAGDRRLLDRDDVEKSLQIMKFEDRPRQRFEQRERSSLVEALDAHGWNVSATARALGMSRGRLRGMMARLGLS